MNEKARLQQLRDELTADLGELNREIEAVYSSLVLPRWGDPLYHGFPRTLYGYVMSCFSLVDALSRCRYDDREQTVRMRRFLADYMGVSADAATVAVQLWRHTLMHTAKPRTLDDPASGHSYRWLLHWREHLPRQEHMRFQRHTDNESILNTGLWYLVEELEAGLPRLFADVEASTRLRGHFLRMSNKLSRQTVRV
jgi:hypothetical protein